MPEIYKDFYTQYAFFHVMLCAVANGTVLALAELQLSVSVFDVHWMSCQSESAEMSEEAVSLSGVVKMRQPRRHLAIPSQTHLHWIHSLKGSPPPPFHRESDKMLILQYTVCCVCVKIVFLLLAYSPIRTDAERNVCIRIYLRKQQRCLKTTHAPIYRR